MSIAEADILGDLGGEADVNVVSVNSSLEWLARDNSLVEDSQEQRDGIAGMEVDWSPEWQ